MDCFVWCNKGLLLHTHKLNTRNFFILFSSRASLNRCRVILLIIVHVCMLWQCLYCCGRLLIVLLLLNVHFQRDRRGAFPRPRLHRNLNISVHANHRHCRCPVGLSCDRGQTIAASIIQAVQSISLLVLLQLLVLGLKLNPIAHTIEEERSRQRVVGMDVVGVEIRWE